MKRSKKLIIIAVTVAAVLAGTLNGLAFAQTENGDDSQPETKWGALLDRVLVVQARSEMRDEALEQRLDKLVDEGKISQDIANQLNEWWQSRPDIPLLRPFRHFGSPCRPLGPGGPGNPAGLFPTP